MCLLCIQVEARDHGSPALTGTTSVTVFVADINDVSPRFVRRRYQYYIDEDKPSGSVIGQLRAVDPEHGEFGVIRYSLAPSAEQVYE